MKQPNLEQRKEYLDIVENSVSVVPIKGTKRSVRLRWMKPYTMERITRVWIERDLASANVEIIAEGKKKLPLMAHYETMAYSLDMRTDLMTMTKKEAERYRAELLLEEKRRSSKTSQNTDAPGGGSVDGSETSDTDAS